jgi:hypothetical protein
MSRRIAIAFAGAVCSAIRAICTAPVNSETTSRTHPSAASDRASFRLQEAAFLRTVDRHNTANVVTADLPRYAGTHVAYLCDVDKVVRAGLILGECGSTAEPLDLFIHLPTAGLHDGERLRVLGVMEPPAMWTDITGHTVYYAFIKARFVDRQS